MSHWLGTLVLLFFYMIYVEGLIKFENKRAGILPGSDEDDDGNVVSTREQSAAQQAINENCTCVNHYLCDRNFNLITNGQGIIDERLGPGDPPSTQCPAGQICCRIPPGVVVPSSSSAPTVSTVPSATTAPPAATSALPAATTAPPAATTARPAATTAPPAATTAPPAATTAPPAATTAPPAATTAPPAATTAPPAVTTAPPAATTAPPAATTAPPVATTAPPAATTAPPAVTTAPPAVTTATTAPPAATTASPAATTAPPAATTAPPAATTVSAATTMRPNATNTTAAPTPSSGTTGTPRPATNTTMPVNTTGVPPTGSPTPVTSVGPPVQNVTAAPGTTPTPGTTATGLPTPTTGTIPTAPPTGTTPTGVTPGTIPTSPPTGGTTPTPGTIPTAPPTGTTPTQPAPTSAGTTSPPVVFPTVSPTTSSPATTSPPVVFPTTPSVIFPTIPSVIFPTTPPVIFPTTIPVVFPPSVTPPTVTASPTPTGAPPTRPPPGSKCGVQYVEPGRVEGMDASATVFAEFPWMLALLDSTALAADGTIIRNAFICGASLIEPNIAMTAAHCLKYRPPPSNLIIRAGEWNTLFSNETLPHQDRSIQNYSIHNDYVNGTLVNDIALLKLDQPVIPGINVVPICLPNLGTSFVGQTCVATGWGRNAFGIRGQYATKLRKVTLPIMDRVQCQIDLRDTRLGPGFILDPTFLCAGGQENMDTCTGDGGGPLVCRTGDGSFVQAGIVSWGIGCGNRSVPGVYVDVAAYREWIRNEIRNLISDTVPR